MDFRTLASAVVFTFALGSPALLAAEEDAIGARSYQTHCAVCHGAAGDGKGEFADVLTVKPADLTALSAKNGGVFPYLAVFHAIDGRAVVKAHGSKDMPIWGEFFKAEVGEAAGPFGAEMMVRAEIVSLVDYIETIQK